MTERNSNQLKSVENRSKMEDSLEDLKEKLKEEKLRMKQAKEAKEREREQQRIEKYVFFLLLVYINLKTSFINCIRNMLVVLLFERSIIMNSSFVCHSYWICSEMLIAPCLFYCHASVCHSLCLPACFILFFLS